MPESQMTLEKAIIILDQLNTTERIDVDRDELREAIKTVKAAAQKQIAMKPIIPYCSNIDMFTGYCPSCGTHQSLGSAAWHKIFNRFCVRCGQRLDWEVKE